MTDCQCSECKMPDQLYYFRCKYCQSVLVTVIKSTRPERCRCSGSWLTYSHSVTVSTKEEETLFARGRVWNPHAPPAQPDPPRAAGPIPPLRTPEEIEARQRERAEFRRAMEDQHERAFQQREEEHNTQ